MSGVLCMEGELGAKHQNVATFAIFPATMKKMYFLAIGFQDKINGM